MTRYFIKDRVIKEHYRIFQLTFSNHNTIIIAVVYENNGFYIYSVLNGKFIGEPIGVMAKAKITDKSIIDYYAKHRSNWNNPKVTEVTEEYK